MGARKRHGGHQNPRQDESSSKRKPSRSEAHKSSGLSPALAAGVLIVLILATGGVYVYNFVDMTEALETLQSRVSKIVAPPLTPSPSAGNEPGPATTKQGQEGESQTAPPDKKEKRVYSKLSITSTYDNKIRGQLDEADALFDRGDFLGSVKSYEGILARYPASPRAAVGHAASLDELSQQKRSNSLLEQSIDEYLKVFDIKDVPKDLLIKAIRRCAERQTFRGWSAKAVQSLKKLESLYPDDIKIKNDLGVKYLLSGRPNEARKVFREVILKKPDDGFALVHYGFILKTTDNKMDEGIAYLQRGVDTRDEGTVDGRFYFHLGDAYFRTGQTNRSEEIFEEAARLKLFRSKWQRSLYNVDRLTSTPWWSLDDTKIAKKFKDLEKHWRTIRDEGLAQMDASGAFVKEDENLREVGDWKQFTLYSRGQAHKNNCEKAPKTCALLEKMPEATACKRGQIKFSVMHPGTHVWPHTGPTNCRIRAHLGLVVPDGPRIRVTDDTRTWKEGKFIIFDDSFEHEVWHDGESPRLVLIVDIWHPDLTEDERRTLSPI